MKSAGIFLTLCLANLHSPVLGGGVPRFHAALSYRSEPTRELVAEVSQHPPNLFRTSGGCYEHDVGHLRPGQSAPADGTCESAICLQDGSITYIGCGPVSPPTLGHCEKETDLTKNYPECCPIFYCTP